MSAVMTGPRPVAVPPRAGIASEPPLDPALRLPAPPGERRPAVADPVVDDPDTEELDLAALLVAASLPPVSPVPMAPATPPRGAPAPLVPASAGKRPPRAAATRGPGAWEPSAPAAVRGLAQQLALGGTVAELGRLGLHLLLAALPLLAISAQVFGLVNMNISAGLLVLPLTAIMLAIGLLRPLSSDRIVVAGMAWGLLATVVYDAFRLDTVYLMGWWGDFIPKMGTWLINTDPSNLAEGAVAGYLWRYLGDGGGIGVVFFVLAAATGLRSLGPRVTVAAAVGFAVFPVWSGLIATVALSPRGQSMMFALTPTTIGLSLIGHLVFGVVLGLGAVRCAAIDTAWPWPPLLERLERRATFGAQVPWASIAATAPRAADPPAAPAAAIDTRDEPRRLGPAPHPASGPLAVPTQDRPRTGPVPVPPARVPGPTGPGSLDAPSWPGAAVRAVRGWPSSPRPAAVGAPVTGGGVPR